MKRLLIAMILLTTAGCAGSYQYQVDQSLLMQENRRLENALYVTHAQLVTLKRENDVLRASSQGTEKNTASPVIPLLRPKRSEPASQDNIDEAPPFAPPDIKNNTPGNTPGSNSIPDSLKSIKITPPYKKTMSEVSPSDEIVFPALIEPEVSSSPAWSPNR